MNLREKIGQKFFVGFHGLQAPDYLLEWLAAGRVGGVILFARNVESPQQLAALTSSLHGAAKTPILIGIDQEGGTVARLRAGFTESPGAMALAAAASDREARVERVSRVLGEEMHALGINWVYAPVLDILYNHQNPSLMTRSFGTTSEQVSALASAAVRGFQAAGVAATAKHFPGLGDTAIDTHLALPALDTPVDQLIARDLAPYRAAIEAGLATVMTTHTIFSALDADLPATLSPVIIRRLLREELGFNGVVSTDCMEMKAISSLFSPGESAVLAALADVDIILFSHTPAMQAAAFDGLLEAVESGRVTETAIDQSIARIERLKAQYAVAAPPDLGVIRRADHLATVREAARAGTVLFSGALPVDLGSGDTLLVEFASHLESGIVESGGLTGLGAIAREKLPGVKTHVLRGWDTASADVDRILADVRAADRLILAMRGAHLQPDQLRLARAILAAAKCAVLICLRSPFDAAALSGAEVVLCTCGDSTPSLEAALDALLGAFEPTGRLPVEVTPA